MKRLLIVALLLLFVGAGQSMAAWDYDTLPALDPAPDDWNASMVWVQNDVLTNTLLLYSSGGDVYGWDPETGETQRVLNPSLGSTNATGPAGMVLSYDSSMLYFHDNGYPTTYLYQYDFNPASLSGKRSLITCEGSIYDLAINPWTDKLWFVSGDYDADNFYLYEVTGTEKYAANGMKAVLRATIPTALANSGTGPIIFKGPDTVLFGEASYTTGTGTFHLVDSFYGTVLESEYANFDGGLADAIYGYNNEIYVATGYGYTMDLLNHDSTDTILEPDSPIMGMAFDGTQFYLGETDPVSGTVSVSVLTNTTAVDLVSPEEGFRYAAMPAPVYDFQAWNPSVAYYGQSIYYAGDDQGSIGIYSYNTVTGANELWSNVDFSEGSAYAYGPAAFTAGGDGYLYFHDNGYPTQNLYRNKLSDASISDTLALSGTIQGSIWDMTWNPWSESLWIATADGDTNTYHLYEIKQNFSGINGNGISFPAPHVAEGGGNGPIVFTSDKYCYYGESVYGGDGYFHKVNVRTGAVTQDVVTLDGGLNAAVYGFDRGIYVSTSDGKAVYLLDPSDDSTTLVAETANSIGDLTFDGSSLILSGNDLLSIWQPVLCGVPIDQTVSSTLIDLYELNDADLCAKVTVANKTYYAGIEGINGTTVESFESIDPDTLDTTGKGPYYLPYNLFNFKLRIPNAGGTARATIYFSHSLSSVTKSPEWWKWDELRGWYLFDGAVFANDGYSVTLTIVDGGEGDADGVANGYVTDPGGPAQPEPNTGVIEKDDTSECFVQATGQASNGVLALIIVLGAAALLSIRKRARQ